MDTRESLIREAVEMTGVNPGDFGSLGDLVTSSRYEGAEDRELACALDILDGHGVNDESYGSATEGPLYVARFDRWLLTVDTQGFCNVWTYPNSERADKAANSMAATGIV